MDQITHEVRLMKWKSVVEACNSRPEGMSARQWLDEQGIKPKTYYYWQRRVRQEAYGEQQQASLPAVKEDGEVTFAELPISQYSEPASSASGSFCADAIITTGHLTIALSNSVSKELMRQLMEAISDAS